MATRPRRVQSRLVFAAALGASVLQFPALAQTVGGPVGGRPITPQRLTSFEPRNPYRPLAAGLLARTRFVADGSGLYAVEVWDLMVGPAKRSEKARLPGAAIIEVRSGTGTLSSDGRSRELRTGATLSLEETTEFTVANGDKEAPLILRATVIRSNRR